MQVLSENLLTLRAMPQPVALAEALRRWLKGGCVEIGWCFNAEGALMLQGSPISVWQPS